MSSWDVNHGVVHGWATKRARGGGSGLLKRDTWKRRWFQLLPDGHLEYSSKPNGAAKGTLDVTGATLSLPCDANAPYSNFIEIQLANHKGSLQVFTDTPADRVTFVSALMAAANGATGASAVNTHGEPREDRSAAHLHHVLAALQTAVSEACADAVSSFSRVPPPLAPSPPSSPPSHDATTTNGGKPAASPRRSVSFAAEEERDPTSPPAVRPPPPRAPSIRRVSDATRPERHMEPPVAPEPPVAALNAELSALQRANDEFKGGDVGALRALRRRGVVAVVAAGSNPTSLAPGMLAALIETRCGTILRYAVDAPQDVVNFCSGVHGIVDAQAAAGNASHATLRRWKRYLGAALVAVGDTAAAIPLLDVVVGGESGPAAAAALCHLGNAHLGDKAHSRALEAFTRAQAEAGTVDSVLGGLAAVGVAKALAGTTIGPKSKTLFATGFATLQRLLGIGHPVVCDALLARSSFFLAAGEHAKAVPAASDALAVTVSVFGADNVRVADAAIRLAVAHKAAGSGEAAVAAYEKALQVQRLVSGPVCADVGATLNNMAIVLKTMGKLEEAVQLYLQAVAVRRQVLGSSHAAVATTLFNLGNVYRMQSRYEDALATYSECLTMRKEVLGTEHAQVGAVLNNIGLTQKASGDLAAAVDTYEEALAIRRATLGHTHPDTAQTLRNRALALKAAGRLDEAAEVFEETASAYAASGQTSKHSDALKRAHSARRLSMARRHSALE